jgi:hypothetical protein
LEATHDAVLGQQKVTGKGVGKALLFGAAAAMVRQGIGALAVGQEVSVLVHHSPAPAFFRMLPVDGNAAAQLR